MTIDFYIIAFLKKQHEDFILQDYVGIYFDYDEAQRQRKLFCDEYYVDENDIPIFAKQIKWEII